MAGLSMTAGPSFGSTFGGARLAVPTRPQAAPVYTGPIYAARIGPGKNWEHYPTNKNGKVQRVKMHVKTGDMVVVVAGSDKGATGKVTKVITKTGEVIVEGANKSTRHLKPRSAEETGQIVEVESTIHHSNVMHWSEKEQVRSRIGFKKEGGKKVRYLKATGEVLDN